MQRLKIIGGLLLAALTAVPALAWQEMAGPPRRFRPFQGKGPGWMGPGGQRRGPHIGQWLKKNQGLPMDQQEQKLRDDPEFQKLPPEQQQHLIERLHHFNNLPPQQRQRMLSRMDAFEHLTPEQQQQARQIFTQIRQLPDERRQPFRKGMRQLADAPAEQRGTLLDSPEFRSAYTDNERDLMRQIVKLDILPPKGAPENPPPGPPAQPK
ncbi:MAG TPA: DUF3106 domain-containing protein [Terriglobales bacterium]|nr:DUF3106 domain-containing protein [Terriglobales bacterium]